MINTGQFGTQTPLQQSAYNPYSQPNMYENPYMQNQQFNNIMPIGQMGYNQYNQAYNQQQMPENNYVFAPASANQQFSSPYYNNYANPQYNYYDPYGYKGYNNEYQNNGYYNNYYGGYYSSQYY